MSQKSGVRSQKSEVRSKEQEKNLASCLLPLASRIAFIFPGQGSQCIGMGKEFYDRYPAAKAVFQEASDILHLDMAKLCFEGPDTKLNLTQNTQPAILTASVAILNILEQEVSIKPKFLAGHSLGEYTALVASKALDFKDAVRLVEIRGRFMQDAVPHGTGAMAAVLGLTGEIVEGICKEVSTEKNIVVPANFNSPEQTVISGHKEAVEKASRLAKDKQAKRVIPLPVSVPSHSPLMKPAAKRLAKEFDSIQIKKLNIPVITNVEAEPLSSENRIKELLERQLYSPVRWVESVKKMKQEGIETAIEIGPGKVLTGLVKSIDSEIKTINIEKIEDLKQLAVNL
ncbi:MAG: ACP S-malonyltransferase [Deltaproteobacteria bacterium]|nr:ACP S-malonyltransferase [Deltaproteobacteria bacterium]